MRQKSMNDKNKTSVSVADDVMDLDDLLDDEGWDLLNSLTDEELQQLNADFDPENSLVPVADRTGLVAAKNAGPMFNQEDLVQGLNKMVENSKTVFKNEKMRQKEEKKQKEKEERLKKQYSRDRPSLNREPTVELTAEEEELLEAATEEELIEAADIALQRGQHDVYNRITVALQKRKQQLQRLQSFSPDDDFSTNPDDTFSSTLSSPTSTLSSLSISPTLTITPTIPPLTNGDFNGTESFKYSSATTSIATASLSSTLTEYTNGYKEPGDNDDFTIENIENNALDYSTNLNPASYTDFTPIDNNKESIETNDESNNLINTNDSINVNAESNKSSGNVNLDDEAFEVIEMNDDNTNTEESKNTRGKRDSTKYIDTGLIPTDKLKNLRQKFSSTLIKENTIKEGVKSIKPVKTRKLSEEKSTSKRVDKSAVKSVSRKRQNSVIDTVDIQNATISPDVSVSIDTPCQETAKRLERPESEANTNVTKSSTETSNVSDEYVKKKSRKKTKDIGDGESDESKKKKKKKKVKKTESDEIEKVKKVNKTKSSEQATEDSKSNVNHTVTSGTQTIKTDSKTTETAVKANNTASKVQEHTTTAEKGDKVSILEDQIEPTEESKPNSLNDGGTNEQEKVLKTFNLNKTTVDHVTDDVTGDKTVRVKKTFTLKNTSSSPEPQTSKENNTGSAFPAQMKQSTSAVGTPDIQNNTSEAISVQSKPTPQTETPGRMNTSSEQLVFPVQVNSTSELPGTAGKKKDVNEAFPVHLKQTQVKHNNRGRESSTIEDFPVKLKPTPVADTPVKIKDTTSEAFPVHLKPTSTTDAPVIKNTNAASQQAFPVQLKSTPDPATPPTRKSNTTGTDFPVQLKPTSAASVIPEVSEKNPFAVQLKPAQFTETPVKKNTSKTVPIQLKPVHSSSNQQQPDKSKNSSTSRSPLQLRSKRKSVDENDSHVNTSANRPSTSTRQIKKLKSSLPEPKTKTKSSKSQKGLSKDYSIDKVRKYNERIKKYNQKVEKENGGVSTTSSPSTVNLVTDDSDFQPVEPITGANNHQLIDSVDLNLNVSINQSSQNSTAVSNSQHSSMIDNVSTTTFKDTDSHEINLDVDIEVSLENSRTLTTRNGDVKDSRISANDPQQSLANSVHQQHSQTSNKHQGYQKPQQQPANCVQQPTIQSETQQLSNGHLPSNQPQSTMSPSDLQHQQQQQQQQDKQDLADTHMVNRMINDIAQRRAQRMVRSKASISHDVKEAATSPLVTPQHSIEIQQQQQQPKKSNDSFAKKLKQKVSNRFTRQSIDKSFDRVPSIDINNNNNITTASAPNQVSSRQHTGGSRATSSRSQYDSGIEQTPSDLIISQDALNYNKEDTTTNTPGIYTYSEEFPDVKLRDKSAKRCTDHRKSREVSFHQNKSKRLSRGEYRDSGDYSDHDSKRKSGSHLRYKRSSSKVKIARERSMDRDKHDRGISREPSMDAASSKKNSLRRQKSHREEDGETATTTIKRRSLSRDKSLSRQKSLSREDGPRSPLKKRKSFDRHKSIERQKSIDRRHDVENDAPKKFKSHKSHFLEELGSAKKKALIQMLRDNKLNLTKELSRKSIDLKEFEKIKKSLARVIKGPHVITRQDSKDEFNAFNIRNKFNKEIARNEQTAVLTKKQLKKETTPTLTKTDKLKSVTEGKELDRFKKTNKNSTDATDTRPALTKNSAPSQPPKAETGGTPKVVFALDEEPDYIAKRKNRRLRKTDSDSDEEIAKEKVSIAQQIDLFNLQKEKEKSKHDGRVYPEGSGNRNLYNQDKNDKPQEVCKSKVSDPLPKKTEPKETSKVEKTISATAATIDANGDASRKQSSERQRKVSPVKRDPPRPKSVEPLSNRAAMFGPRKVFKQVKPPSVDKEDTDAPGADGGAEKKSGLKMVANLRSTLRKTGRRLSQDDPEKEKEKVLPSGTFLLPDPEQVARKVSKTGGLAALLEQDANKRDNLKFEDKPKKPGFQEKEDIRGISAASLQNALLKMNGILTNEQINSVWAGEKPKGSISKNTSVKGTEIKKERRVAPKDEETELDVVALMKNIKEDSDAMFYLCINNQPKLEKKIKKTIIDSVRTSKKMKHLSLAMIGLIDFEIKDLTEAIRINTQLETINLESNVITQHGLAPLMKEIQRHPNIREVKIANQKQPFGGNGEECMATAIDKNENILKFGYSFKAPGPRNKADRAIIRHNEALRQKRRQGEDVYDLKAVCKIRDPWPQPWIKVKNRRGLGGLIETKAEQMGSKIDLDNDTRRESRGSDLRNAVAKPLNINDLLAQRKAKLKGSKVEELEAERERKQKELFKQMNEQDKAAEKEDPNNNESKTSDGGSGSVIDSLAGKYLKDETTDTPPEKSPTDDKKKKESGVNIASIGDDDNTTRRRRKKSEDEGEGINFGEFETEEEVKSEPEEEIEEKKAAPKSTGVKIASLDSDDNKISRRRRKKSEEKDGEGLDFGEFEEEKEKKEEEKVEEKTPAKPAVKIASLDSDDSKISRRRRKKSEDDEEGGLDFGEFEGQKEAEAQEEKIEIVKEESKTSPVKKEPKKPTVKIASLQEEDTGISRRRRKKFDEEEDGSLDFGNFEEKKEEAEPKPVEEEKPKPEVKKEEPKPTKKEELRKPAVKIASLQEDNTSVSRRRRRKKSEDEDEGGLDFGKFEEPKTEKAPEPEPEPVKVEEPKKVEEKQKEEPKKKDDWRSKLGTVKIASLNDEEPKRPMRRRKEKMFEDEDKEGEDEEEKSEEKDEDEEKEPEKVEEPASDDEEEEGGRVRRRSKKSTEEEEKYDPFSGVSKSIAKLDEPSTTVSRRRRKQQEEEEEESGVDIFERAAEERRREEEKAKKEKEEKEEAERKKKVEEQRAKLADVEARKKKLSLEGGRKVIAKLKEEEPVPRRRKKRYEWEDEDETPAAKPSEPAKKEESDDEENESSDDEAKNKAEEEEERKRKESEKRKIAALPEPETAPRRRKTTKEKIEDDKIDPFAEIEKTELNAVRNAAKNLKALPPPDTSVRRRRRNRDEDEESYDPFASSEQTPEPATSPEPVADDAATRRARRQREREEKENEEEAAAEADRKARRERRAKEREERERKEKEEEEEEEKKKKNEKEKEKGKWFTDEETKSGDRGRFGDKKEEESSGGGLFDEDDGEPKKMSLRERMARQRR